MRKNSFLFLLFVAGFFCACQRPDDGISAKTEREANIEKYVQKGQEVNRIQQERAAPLPWKAPINVSSLTQNSQNLEAGFLTALLTRNRQILECRLQETHGQKMADKLADTMNKYVSQVQEAARQNYAAEELGQHIKTILQAQTDEVRGLLDSQKNAGRLPPAQEMLDKTQQRLNRRAEDILTRIELYHGQTAVQESRAVLQRSIEDYIYAMASAKDDKVLDEKISLIAQNGEKEILQICEEKGDPLGITPEDLITSMRADMITTHQTLEKQIEILYGKDAVLQARKVFNQLLTECGQTLRENTRLSQKKTALNRLNEHYGQTLLSLQQQWNAELKQRTQRPPEYLVSLAR